MSKNRKRLVNNSQFKTAKKLRRAILGKYCETCGSKFSTLGHHVFCKTKSGLLEVQMRCSQCETTCHQQRSDGNPAWAMRIFIRNNETIKRFIETT